MTNEVNTLQVLLGDRRVGMLLRLPDDGITFAFDPTYSNDPDRPTLSLGFKMPGGRLFRQPKTQTRLPPYFANLLPEGALRDYLARKLGVKAVRDFPLIAALGGDLPGNVRVQADSAGPLHDALPIAQATGSRPLKFSLAGVQLKFSALESAAGGLSIPITGEGGDWIVKLPSSTFPNLPAHEMTMLELARSIGIPVPEVRLVSMDTIAGMPGDIPWQEREALAVCRFDRQDGRRIHTEDFAQVFRQYPEDKYNGASSQSLGRVLLAESGVGEVMELVKRLVFTVLIGNADMHLKNWSLIYEDGRRPKLSPAYDYVSTVIYMIDNELGLSLGGTKVIRDIGLDHFARFADKVGVPSRAVSDLVHGTVADFKMEWRNSSLVRQLPEQQAERLEAHFHSLTLWRAG